MSFARCIDTAIIIPARDEAARIATCLAALAAQCTERVQVILVVNNTTDATARIARAEAQGRQINLRILELSFAPELGVGEARRLGAAQALHSLPHLQYLLTTDADCCVAPDWVARSLRHLQAVDAVCGRVALLPGEVAWLAGLDRLLLDHEMRYRELVQRVFARHAPNCADLHDSHGQTPGASLGFTRDAYVAARGFDPIPCGEDREIMRRMRGMGMRVRHVSDLRVSASCRLTGRAVGGMSDTLRQRLAGHAYVADDCLPPAAHLIQQARRGQLGPWPPKVAPGDCIAMHKLPEHSAKIEDFLARPALAPTAALPPQSAVQPPAQTGQQTIYAAPATDG